MQSGKLFYYFGNGDDVMMMMYICWGKFQNFWNSTCKIKKIQQFTIMYNKV